MDAVAGCEDKKCPYCAELIKAEAVKCRFCGEALVKTAPAKQALPSPKPGEKADMTGLWLLMAPGVLILLFFGYGWLKTASETTAEREQRVAEKAIELCREGVNDDLSELSTRRFARGACDKMEEDYYWKYGRKP